jgi:hypothetical protein
MKRRKQKLPKIAHPALLPESLLGKARLYIGRALDAKGAKEEDLYQLWATMGLELLAKASLSRIHPSLVVESVNPNSLLEANGISTGTAVRTIDAHVAFARLKHTVPHFGTPAFKACESLTARRNAELHSGQAAFVGIPLEVWEGDFWSAVELILGSMELDLDGWLGKNAKEPKKLLVHLAHVKSEAAKKRVAHAATMFEEDSSGRKRNKREKEELREASMKLHWFEHNDRFKYYSGKYWRQECPACKSSAFLAGDKVYEELAEDQDDMEPGYELVDIQYAPVEFLCPTCGLELDGETALAAVGLDETHEDQEEREIEYEPDYGND